MNLNYANLQARKLISRVKTRKFYKQAVCQSVSIKSESEEVS